MADVAGILSAFGVEAWLTASRESFGPLPESDRPFMRRSAEAGAMSEAA